MKNVNHYKWLNKHLETFLRNLGVKNPDWYLGCISAHGDKFYCYRSQTIPFPHIAAIGILTYIPPYSEEVREVNGHWVDVKKWIHSNYDRFKPFLPEIDDNDPDVLSPF